MPNHVLSPYWAVMHRRPQDYDFFKKLAPPVVKIMDGGPNDYAWVRDNLPNATVVARDWLLDDNHGQEWAKLLADPAATGKRHANEWKAKQAKLGFDPAKTLCMGVNEPKVWEQGNAAVKPTTTYTIAFLEELKRLGLRGVALSLSVGWPRNDGADRPPLWSEFPGVEAVIKSGNHVLGLHEYWMPSGPAQGWGWLAGRALKCPWQVPILIGECGMSAAVNNPNPVPTPEQGWRKHISADTYADQLVDYHNRMAADSRVMGLCVYLCDYANNEWWSKDLEPAYSNVLARKGQLRDRATAPTPPPVTPPVPIPAGGTMWQWPLKDVQFTWFWGVPGGSGFTRRTSSVSADTYPAHEGLDMRAVVGTQVYACADGTVAFVGTHTAYGNYIRIRHGAAGKQWDSFYAHLVKLPALKVGAKVKMGDPIAISGKSGTTAAHLHFEIRLVKPDGSWDVDAPGAMHNGAVDPVAFFNGLERAAAGGAPDANPFRLADFLK